MDKLVNLNQKGQLSDVVEEAQILTKKYPNAFIVWKILGSSAAQIGELDKAIEAYNKCIFLKPDYADAYINLGVAFKAQGKLFETINAYQKFIDNYEYEVSINMFLNMYKSILD